jgi:hypothetical protein
MQTQIMVFGKKLANLENDSPIGFTTNDKSPETIQDEKIDDHIRIVDKNYHALCSDFIQNEVLPRAKSQAQLNRWIAKNASKFVEEEHRQECYERLRRMYDHHTYYNNILCGYRLAFKSIEREFGKMEKLEI